MYAASTLSRALNLVHRVSACCSASETVPCFGVARFVFFRIDMETAVSELNEVHDTTPRLGFAQEILGAMQPARSVVVEAKPRAKPAAYCL